MSDKSPEAQNDSTDEIPDEMPVVSIGRILVALDASPHSLNALRAAAELAAVTESELQGLYVEDLNLLRMCGLPFVREIGSYSAAARLPDSRAIEREFQSQADKIRHTLAQTAVSSNLRWSFRVTRGMVSTELLAAAESAGLVTLGRVGRSPGKRFGSTAQAMVRRSMCPLLVAGRRRSELPAHAALHGHCCIGPGAAAGDHVDDEPGRILAGSVHGRHGPEAGATHAWPPTG